MIKVIKKLLIDFINRIDAGNSNLSEEECVEIIHLISRYSKTDEPMSKYQAHTYLEMSRSKFDALVAEGKLPQGQKQSGFKELFWYKKELDEAYKKLNNNG